MSPPGQEDIHFGWFCAPAVRQKEKNQLLLRLHIIAIPMAEYRTFPFTCFVKKKKLISVLKCCYNSLLFDSYLNSFVPHH